MPKYVIERNIPDVGKMPQDQLRAVARKSSAVMQDMGHIHWVQSYITDNKIYCVYVAPDEDSVRKHAAATGLPADRVSLIQNQADATTGE